LVGWLVMDTGGDDGYVLWWLGVGFMVSCGLLNWTWHGSMWVTVFMEDVGCCFVRAGFL